MGTDESSKGARVGGRGRLILLGSLFVVGVVAVTAALPPITGRLSGEPGEGSPRETPEVAVERLDGIDQLKAAFNEDVGLVRIVLLLSPT
jgi:hypothetical protein